MNNEYYVAPDYWMLKSGRNAEVFSDKERLKGNIMKAVSGIGEFKPDDFIGKTVIHKEDSRNPNNIVYGTVVYSSFGYSISGINKEGAHWQTLGDTKENILKYWDVVEEEVNDSKD